MNASNELLAEVTIDMSTKQSLPKSVHHDELVAHEVLRQMQESQEPGQILPIQSHHHQDGQEIAESPTVNHDSIQDIPYIPTDPVKWNEMLYKLCLYTSRNSQDANVIRPDKNEDENPDITELGKTKESISSLHERVQIGDECGEACNT
jgi:hypothetical protein